MKQKIYVSLPISGKEDSYPERLTAAVQMLSKKFPDAVIVTPKMVEENVKAWLEHVEPTYGQYLGADIAAIIDECDAVVFDQHWERSRGCLVEFHTARIFEKRMLFMDGDKMYEWEEEKQVKEVKK